VTGAGQARGWVVYCEVPDFYVEVERSRDPALRARPLLVGGRPDKRGKVQSASAEARARGVEVGMPTAEACSLCPDARLQVTRMAVYREASGLLRAALRQEAEALELDGLGAAYLDGGNRDADARRLGERLLVRVREATGLPLRVGIGPDKRVAWMAAQDDAARRAPVFVAREQVAQFMAPLPVSRLPHVGPKTLAALERLGIETLGDLMTRERAELEEALGRQGARIFDMVTRGDTARIRGMRHPQTLSREQTLDGAELDPTVLEDQLARLARRLAGALRRDGLAARRVALRLHYADEEKRTRSVTLDEPVHEADAIRREAIGLLERTDAGERPIRKLGVMLGGLASAGETHRQLDLFDAAAPEAAAAGATESSDED